MVRRSWWCGGEVGGEKKATQSAEPTCDRWCMVQDRKGLGASLGVRALPAAVCWVQCLAIKMRVVASLS